MTLVESTPQSLSKSLGSKLHGLAYDPGPNSLSYDEWAADGALLSTMDHALRWWVGDWLLYGEHVMGEKYAQAADATGYSIQSLKNMMWVSERIPASRRRDQPLTWSHHSEVAADEEAQQNEWLTLASEYGWSVAELRRQRRQAQGEDVGRGLPEKLESLVKSFDQLLTDDWLDAVAEEYRSARLDAAEAQVRALDKHVGHLHAWIRTRRANVGAI